MAVENQNEINQRVSRRLGKVWRFLRTADKVPYKIKVAKAFAVHRRNYADCTYNLREGRRRMEQARRVNEIASNMKNDSSDDQEQLPSTF